MAQKIALCWPTWSQSGHSGESWNAIHRRRLENGGGPRPRPTAKQQNDLLFPETSEILEPTGLTQQKLDALESLRMSLTFGTAESRSIKTALSE